MERWLVSDGAAHAARRARKDMAPLGADDADALLKRLDVLHLDQEAGWRMHLLSAVRPARDMLDTCYAETVFGPVVTLGERLVPVAGRSVAEMRGVHGARKRALCQHLHDRMASLYGGYENGDSSSFRGAGDEEDDEDEDEEEEEDAPPWAGPVPDGGGHARGDVLVRTWNMIPGSITDPDRSAACAQMLAQSAELMHNAWTPEDPILVPVWRLDSSLASVVDTPARADSIVPLVAASGGDLLGMCVDGIEAADRVARTHMYSDAAVLLTAISAYVGRRIFVDSATGFVCMDGDTLDAYITEVAFLQMHCMRALVPIERLYISMQPWGTAPPPDMHQFLVHVLPADGDAMRKRLAVHK